MTSATLSILHLVCVHAEHRLVANKPRFQKEQTGRGKKRMKRKKKTRREMREEEGGEREGRGGHREQRQASLSCTNSLSGGLE